MTTSHNPPPAGDSPRRGHGQRVGLGLLFLALAGIALGVVGLVAFWVRRLGRPR